MKSLGTTDVNKETVSQVSQKVGENGELITVSITTEESHQSSVTGNYTFYYVSAQHVEALNNYCTQRLTPRVKFPFSQNLDVGPEESHSVHKIRTTKIVFEETAPLLESSGTITISKSSKRAEVSIEESGNFLLNPLPMEKVVCENNELTISVVADIIDTEKPLEDRGVDKNIAMIYESKKPDTLTSEEEDMKELMERIMKQRSALDDIFRSENGERDEDKIEEIAILNSSENQNAMTEKNMNDEILDSGAVKTVEEKISIKVDKTLEVVKPQLEGSHSIQISITAAELHFLH